MANIVRWDPFGEMLSLRQAVDKLFEDAWVRPSRVLPGGDGNGAAPYLPIDLYETPDELVVTASVPGVKPEDIEITVQGDVLTIRGEFKMDQAAGEGKYHRRELRYGQFTRQIALPTSVHTEHAEAHFDNGVVKLRLPKAEGAKQRRIQVQSGTPTQPLTPNP